MPTPTLSSHGEPKESQPDKLVDTIHVTTSRAIDDLSRQMTEDISRRDDLVQKEARHTSSLSLCDLSPHTVDLVVGTTEDDSGDQTQAKRPSDDILAMRCVCPQTGFNDSTLPLAFLQSMVTPTMVDQVRGWIPRWYEMSWLVIYAWSNIRSKVLELKRVGDVGAIEIIHLQDQVNSEFAQRMVAEIAIVSLTNDLNAAHTEMASGGRGSLSGPDTDKEDRPQVGTEAMVPPASFVPAPPVMVVPNDDPLEFVELASFIDPIEILSKATSSSSFEELIEFSSMNSSSSNEEFVDVKVVAPR
ncbi:hypothetical protein TIFTF001_029781 [Ficus carica]|uniref:Uncharacterized protein n=1 Tax=Ficus carica TaxID=3494 RepID=A0AA88DS60_FICCA|nr:hypothetical protein TIFTF001_029781 [Ficus carica]